MNILVYHNGHQAGPFDADSILQGLANGALSSSDLAWQEGMANWTSLGEMFPQARGQAQSGAPPLGAAPTRMKEYKVLSQKDKWFSQKFDPEMLTQALNSYAQQGWRVVAASTATFPGMLGGNREEIIVILERDK